MLIKDFGGWSEHPTGMELEQNLLINVLPASLLGLLIVWYST